MPAHTQQDHCQNGAYVQLHQKNMGIVHFCGLPRILIEIELMITSIVRIVRGHWIGAEMMIMGTMTDRQQQKHKRGHHDDKDSNVKIYQMEGHV